MNSFNKPAAISYIKRDPMVFSYGTFNFISLCAYWLIANENEYLGCWKR